MWHHLCEIFAASAVVSFIERQNHPVPEVDRHCRQGQIEEVARDHVQLGFEYLQRWTPYHLDGKPVPLFDHADSKSFLLHSEEREQNLLCFSLCPLAPGSVFFTLLGI